MKRWARWARALAGVTLLLSACGDDSPGWAGVCDADRLANALAQAGPGDRVQVGACRVTADPTVPARATLEGAGRGPGVTLEDVTVSGQGEALGAIAQGGAIAEPGSTPWSGRTTD